MANHTITVRHNFETGHRLPHLGGKCQSLHGHSWWADWVITAPYNPTTGTVVEFGEAKKRLRAWVDTHLDHGVMLGRTDPLAKVLPAYDTKTFWFGDDTPSEGLEWPTVENVAELLARVGDHLLADLEATVTRCRVTETHVNAAEWIRP